MSSKISKKSQKSDVTLAFLKSVSCTRKWYVIDDFCAQEQKLSPQAFQVLISIYKRTLKQKSAARTSAFIETFIFGFNFIPQGLQNAADVRDWNHLLRWFMQLSGNTDAADEEVAKSLIYDWWKNLRNRHLGEANLFKLIAKTTVLTAETWQGIFPKQKLLRDFPDEMLLHCGEIDLLIERGESNYVIHYLNKFDMVNAAPEVKAVICRWAAMIPTKEMLEYLCGAAASPNKIENFRIFAIHPLGLLFLMQKDCFGLIAQMEKPFRAVVNDYPSVFTSFASRETYASCLSKALDEAI